MSNGSQTQWIFALQSAFGVPADNASVWNRMRFNGGGLKRGTQTEEDPEIGEDAPAAVTSEAAATGSFDMSLWYGMLDPFLEALAGGTWTGDVLTSGGTLRYFTFEEYQPDLLQDPKYISYPDTAPTEFSLTFPTPNGRIQASFGFSASEGNPGNASLNAGGSAAVINSEPVMRTGSLVSNLTIDGNPVESYGLKITNLVLSSTRETEDEPLVNVDGRGAISYGDFTVNIEMTSVDDNREIVNSLFDNVSRTIAWQVRDVNGKGYNFELTNASPNGGDVSDPQKNTSRVQTLPFAGSGLTITRVP